MSPKAFDLSDLGGLTDEEAARRLAAEGPNELPSAKKRGPFAIALEVVKEPMFLLLIACGSLYLLLGDVKEALLLLGFVFVVIGITLVQERKTERALDALRDLSSPRALVIRDGEKQRIAGREVVRGDIVLLSEGDRVPADAVVRSATNLSVDESLLTGESVPVGKSAARGPLEPGPPGGDDLPFVYLGHAGRQGPGRRRGPGHRRRDGDGQDRQGAARCSSRRRPRSSARRRASCGSSPSSASGSARWSSSSSRSRAATVVKGLLAGLTLGHGDAAGGVPGRPDDLPGARAPGGSRSTRC